jgi:anti-anti-sigma regulatory factor
MAGAISILSFTDVGSTAALVGPFTGESSEFLAQHLDELPGDVALDCEHLDDLDESSAAILLEFRESRGAQGRQVIFRSITPQCRETLVRQAALGAHCTQRSSAG